MQLPSGTNPIHLETHGTGDLCHIQMWVLNCKLCNCMRIATVVSNPSHYLHPSVHKCGSAYVHLLTYAQDLPLLSTYITL